jgi:hypothetical protein
MTSRAHDVARCCQFTQRRSDRTVTPHPQVKLLDRLVGTWTTEATHPDVPGVVVHGTTTMEWLDGKQFLIVRSDTDHPQFPGAICVIGDTEQDRVADGGGTAPPGDANRPLRMHYFDTRGVYRLNDASIDETAWKWWREAAGFSQRFTGTFADGGSTIVGQSQLRRDDVTWKDDLKITYRRKEAAR